MNKEELSKLQTEKVILVDENNNEIGTASKLVAHKQGLLHRAFSLFILSQENTNINDIADIQVLIQQRAATKYHSQSLWSNSCCSHPRLGEDIKDAAHRRAQEELNIVLDLNKIHFANKFIYQAQVSHELIEHEYDVILYSVIPFTAIEKLSAKINQQEISQIKWIGLSTLLHNIKQQPKKFTPWLQQATMMLQQKLNT